MTTSTRVMRFALAALSATLIAAACGDDAVEEPAVEEPAAEEPAVEEPAVEEPAVEEPAVEEPAAEEPAVEEPAVEEPAVEEPAAEEPAALDLAGVCPNPLVIQTGWYPDASRAWFWGLVEGGEIDANGGRYSGPAKADPNLTIEIRAGGPLTGFQQNNSLLYSDRDILIADQHLDAMVSASRDFPTVAVMAPMQKHPQILMWDPDDLDINDITDIRDSGATVLVSANLPYPFALAGLGLLDESQIDDSWDFSPTRFIAEDGIVQQGFVIDAPYNYENDIEAFGKPVEYILVSEAGYPNYGPIATVHPETMETEADCLAAFVPVLQQEVLSYLDDPLTTNELSVELAAAFSSPVPLTLAHEQDAANKMISDDLIGNGPSGILGEFDLDRVQTVIDIVTPVLVAQGAAVDTELTAEELVTNDFLDPSISQ